ncbi:MULTISPECIES: hypothetical protein [unclassified Streptomyces]|uniref:hypothetical protein n=1 Tax=unclassified Streptomyces TaxID=2593676 RepID=UPI00236640F9|nr:MULTISPECIES: hypothetical protein [unclassified Streptomyces]MDF3141410.1 hypothetical protein [Streptomyces sp. T21Q-yed]WDF44980.1 hypothetical protein PBV52_00130 [Streptomyces sp. T12]
MATDVSMHEVMGRNSGVRQQSRTGLRIRLKGRWTEVVDPAKGKLTTTYDDDRPLTVTSTVNGATKTLITEYDVLDRKTGIREDAKDSAHQRTKFILTGSRGMADYFCSIGYSPLGEIEETPPGTGSATPSAPPCTPHPALGRQGRLAKLGATVLEGTKARRRPPWPVTPRSGWVVGWPELR